MNAITRLLKFSLCTSLFAGPWLLSAEDKPGVKFLTPTEAIEKMTYPEGFKVVAFAAEPEIVQPFAFTFDDRGRVWLCENLNYETRGSDSFDEGPKGRIVILEDRDGDGRMDHKKLFKDEIFFPTGIALGFGGVWVGSPPNLLFIPDRDGDDVPDADPEIVLDGWGRQDRHETMNSFMWGPDGWLYGLHGVFTHSKVGKPGTPDADRARINAGVWRYHPTKQDFEVFAWGTSNPWGMDFNEHGQIFITACVIPHLWHMIQGGRYHRQGGKHFNPHIYDDIKTIADHRHASAHGGARFYLADQFPETYRGRLFMCNIHEHGVLTDVIKRDGSGFIGEHGDHFSMANDKQWLGFYMELGPDGSMYVLDWHDEDICGRKVIHRDTGRLYRISYGDAKNPAFNLAEKSVAELVEIAVEAKNEWHSRQARRILHERHAAGKIDANARAGITRKLVGLLKGETPVPKKLRALWTLHITGSSSERLLNVLLKHPDEYLRAWAIQLLAEDGEVSSDVLGQWAAMARDDASPVVRLYLASAAQRIPEAARWPILENLALHESDRDDHNLPLMNWFALEPLVMADPDRAIALAGKTKIDLLARNVARRISSEVVPFKAKPKEKLIKELPADSVSDEGLRLHLSVASLVPGPIERWGDVAQAVEAARPVVRSGLGGRKAVLFDGEDDFFELAHRDELAFADTNDFTLAAWVFPDEKNPGWRGVVTKARDAGPWYGLWIHGRQWRSGASKGETLHGPDTHFDWEHLAIVQRAGVQRMYVDGYLVKSGKPVDGSGKGSLWIGGAASTREFFKGGINELRIYGRGLSAGEISYLADLPNAQLPEEPKPIAPTDAFSLLLVKLGQTAEPRLQTALLTGIREGLAGNSNIAVPESWAKVYTSLANSKNAEVVSKAKELSVLFGDEVALEQVRKTMLNADLPADERRKAMETLVQRRAEGLAKDLHQLLDQMDLRDAVLRSLTVVPDKSTAAEILKRYPDFSPSDKLTAINTLATRETSGLALLKAIESKLVPRKDVNPASARQLANLGSAEVSEKLATVWGTIRPKKDHSEIRKHYEKILKPDIIAKADPVKGRLVFDRLCGQCHRMFDTGGTLAPELTGSDRRNLTYMLDNVLDPNADIGKDYEYNTFTLKDDRVLLGVIVRETDKAVVIKTLEGEVTVSITDLKARAQLPVSMMPEGLFQTLTDDEVKDLVRYLQSDAQVPLPPEEE